MGSSNLFLTLFIHPCFLPGILYRVDERSQNREDCPRGGGENDLLQHLLHLPVPRQVLPARAAEAHGGLVSCRRGGQDAWAALPEWGSRDEFGLPPGPESSACFPPNVFVLESTSLKHSSPHQGISEKGGDISGALGVCPGMNGPGWLQAEHILVLESGKLYGDVAGHSCKPLSSTVPKPPLRFIPHCLSAPLD